MAPGYVAGPPRNTAEPATRTVAPARAARGAVSAVIPPSTSIAIGRPPINAFARPIASQLASMKA